MNVPEHRKLLERVESPMVLWIKLHRIFEQVMRDGNDDLARRILAYAAWCVSDRSGQLPNDSSTAAICAFYEHLPLQRTNWPRFREWFTRSEFHHLLPHFAYFLSEAEMDELCEVYFKEPPIGPVRRNRGWRKSAE